MKVVLFCGGLGTRIRHGQDVGPKPMVNIGDRPILWHLMKYYAHFGHNDFILCLGYKANVLKEYFLNLDDCDVEGWRITFVDTGIASNIGQRLKAVEQLLIGEEVFLANYADGLTDLPLPRYLQYFLRRDKIGSFLCVRPTQSFHVVSVDGDVVTGIDRVARSRVLMNGGYFIFRQDIFEYLQDGDDLVEATFQRLIEARQLIGYRYDGFWACMDTFKEKQRLEELYTRGDPPWKVWSATDTTDKHAGEVVLAQR
jgi:glucose-1-phosphate cytidylyltransferase